MMEGRAEQDWLHTSHLLALQANCHRDPKRSPVHPAELNLFYQWRKRFHQPKKHGVEVLRHLATNHVEIG